MPEPALIDITTYNDSHHHRFVELNREWLVRYGLYEPPDAEQLGDPNAHFLTPGGQVFIALSGTEVVGTAAVVPHGPPGHWEVAKLAVDARMRGQGLGRRLVEECIAFAKQHGARTIALVSNHQLVSAIRIYESLGFEHRPLTDATYATADVYMELDVT